MPLRQLVPRWLLCEQDLVIKIFWEVFVPKIALNQLRAVGSVKINILTHRGLLDFKFAKRPLHNALSVSLFGGKDVLEFCKRSIKG